MLERQPDGIRRRRLDCIHSVFVYGGDDLAGLQGLLRKLTADDRAAVVAVEGTNKTFVVADMVDFCGPMSGLRITAADPPSVRVFVFRGQRAEASDVISLDRDAVLLKVRYEGITVFLFAGTNIIDIDAELSTGIFDIRDHFLAALPIVLYIKWAFSGTCWSAPETNACFIIDDPLLKPNYGFIDFRELLSLMRSHRFSTNIAFIPWNYRRSDPTVAEMFTKNRDYYSISVHGCDHTKGEFGNRDKGYLSTKLRLALQRMSAHESRTGIRHDRVMVFPQGVFSEAAMGVLKHTELIASVNNDTISSDPDPRAIKISDVWDVAIMAYSSFPLFTRRYPWEGIENFAFDSLLGKPCIAVIHHDFCRDHYAHLLGFIEKVNGLRCELIWRTLGEVVQRSCRQREISADVVEVDMYRNRVASGESF